MRLDLLIASASAGLLLYSGWLLIPTARLRPKDIIADAYIPQSGYMLGPEDVSWPIFPEDTTVLRIHDALDGKAGFGLLIVGTIGGVLATIAGAFTLRQNVPSGLDIAEAAVALILGLAGGRLWTTRAGRRGELELHLLRRCFMEWLEKVVGDSKTEGENFGLMVVSAARHSGCSLMGELLADMGTVLSDEDERAITHRVVDLARECRHHWGREDFHQWAGEVASKRHKE